jgi:hypothetical protein
MSNAHGRRGRWVNMLQDFSFKIVHWSGFRHTNVDALSRNPVGLATNDNDFSEEIQDIVNMWTDESAFVFSQVKKESGSVPGTGIRNWYSTVPVALGSTITGTMATISYM